MASTIRMVSVLNTNNSQTNKGDSSILALYMILGHGTEVSFHPATAPERHTCLSQIWAGKQVYDYLVFHFLLLLKDRMQLYLFEFLLFSINSLTPHKKERKQAPTTWARQIHTVNAQYKNYNHLRKATTWSIIEFRVVSKINPRPWTKYCPSAAIWVSSSSSSLASVLCTTALHSLLTSVKNSRASELLALLMSEL